jgi:FkbM family methyltransferase
MNELIGRMRSLKNKGFSPETIVDVGANMGLWSAHVIQVFPQSNYFLIDGNPNVEDRLGYMSKHNQNINYSISLLSDQEETAVFHIPKSNPVCTGASILRERTKHYRDDDCVSFLEIETQTLDSLLKKESIENVDFLKLDVQGAELMVLGGGLNTLKNVSYLSLEVQFQEYNTGAPVSEEVINFVNKQGFQLYDIFDRGYHDDFLTGADFLFQSRKAKTRNRL